MEAVREHRDVTSGMGSVMERIAALPRVRARFVGVVYLFFFLTAILGALLTPGTSSDILAHQALFRWGFAVSLISLAFYVALTVLFYNLFRPVNRALALLAAFFSLVGCVMQAVGCVFQLAPLVLLGSGQSSSAFNVQQLQALAQMFLNLNVQAGYVGIVFFGLFDIAIGYLILKSTFLPRILGVPMVIAGLTWLIFLSPPLANDLLTFIQVIGFLAEAALMLWLLVMGVNVQRWKEQAQ
jgi:Domain of unknown function (DUF4386)